MVRSAIILLLFTAVGGLVMAGLHFSGQPRPPPFIAALHGLLAGCAMGLLLYEGVTAGLPRLVWSGIAVLGIAGAGGLLLYLNYHRRRRRLPTPIMALHAALALAALALLSVGGWNA